MATNPSAPLQASQPIPTSEQPQALSEAQRLIGTFFSPGNSFFDLRRNASWWAPFLIIAIVSVSFVTVVDQKVGFRKVIENLIQLQPKQADRIDRLPADQREAVLRQQAAITKWIAYSVPIVALVIYAVFAALLLATLKFTAGADIKYKTLFAVIVYSRLPLIFGPLLAILSLLAGVSSDGFNLRNPVATNPGYFVGPDASPVLRTFLTQLDVFSLWSLILTAIGIAAISKVKRGTAFAVVFGWFGVYVVGQVILAAVSS